MQNKTIKITTTYFKQHQSVYSHRKIRAKPHLDPKGKLVNQPAIQVYIIDKDLYSAANYRNLQKLPNRSVNFSKKGSNLTSSKNLCNQQLIPSTQSTLYNARALIINVEARN